MEFLHHRPATAAQACPAGLNMPGRCTTPRHATLRHASPRRSSEARPLHATRLDLCYGRCIHPNPHINPINS